MKQALFIPIPSDRSVDGWKNVGITECGEPLVELTNYSTRIHVSPQYFIQGIPHSLKEVFCRQSVADMLVKAADLLPVGYHFLIWDGWRPTGVQRELFQEFKGKIKQKHPELDDPGLDSIVEKYVSLPSTHETKPSPHLTGGAIDLTITDANNKELDMGTGFDHFGPEAQTDFYETITAPSEAQLLIQKNRRFLYNLLISAGFVNYPHEWWHFDYGNQFWGIQTAKNAIYNKINAFT